LKTDTNHEDEPEPSKSRPTTKIVNILGWVHFVLGCLTVLIGVYAWLLSGLLVSAFGHHWGIEVFFTELAGVAALMTLLFACPEFVAARGIWRRRSWGYTLALIVGVVDGFLALFGLLAGSIGFIVVFGGSSLFTVVVLFNERYADEFEK
jgi:hypothetical protein